MQPVPSRQRTKVHLLNEYQATLIITYLGNTALARQFYAARKELIKRPASCEIEKPARAFTDWKYTDSWSYKNISDLLCKIVTGMTTKQLRVTLGIVRTARASTHIAPPSSLSIRA